MFNRKRRQMIASVICIVLVAAMIITMALAYLG